MDKATDYFNKSKKKFQEEHTGSRGKTKRLNLVTDRRRESDAIEREFVNRNRKVNPKKHKGGTLMRKNLKQKLSKSKTKLAIGIRVSPTTKRVKRVKKVLDYDYPYQGPEKYSPPFIKGSNRRQQTWTQTGENRRRKVTKQEEKSLQKYISKGTKIKPKKPTRKQFRKVIQDYILPETTGQESGTIMYPKTGEEASPSWDILRDMFYGYKNWKLTQ